MAAEETATAAKAIRVFFIEKFSKVEKRGLGISAPSPTSVSGSCYYSTRTKRTRI
jgi:hypothetical protein